MQKKDNKEIAKKVLRVACKTEIKATGEGTIEAYVSIFNNIDSYGDIIRQGAFAESIAKKLPMGVWSHNWEKPIAKTLVAREDTKGLFIKAQFVKGVQQADEAYALIKAGVINEFSIGLRVLDWEYDEADHRIIKKAKLYEWSPVVAGANPATELVSIKEDEQGENGAEPAEEGENEPAGAPVNDDEPKDGENDPADPNKPAEGENGEAPGEGTPENDDKPAGEGSGEGDPAPGPEAPAESEPEPEADKADVTEKLNKIIVALQSLMDRLDKGTATGGKVDAEPGKILRIKQATREIDKNAECILRIINRN